MNLCVVKNGLSAFFRFLNKPFKCDFGYFISLYFFIVILDTVSVILGSSVLTFWFTGAILAYLGTLVYGLLKPYKVPLKVYNIFIWTVIVIFFIIDFSSLYVFGQTLNKEYSAAIVNTNESEMREFFQMYFTWGIVLSNIVALVFFFILKKYIPKLARVKWLPYIFYIIVPIGCYLFVTCDMDKRSIVGKFYLLITPDKTPDLKDYYTHPVIEFDYDSLPDNVVMIVGESLSRSHCSLYGYDKRTQPKLETLRDTADLILFADVESASDGTESSLRDVFTTYPELDNVPGEWYKSTTLFEIVNQLGYKSFWVSNQSKKGLFDNVIGKFSDLCDENYFVGNKFSGTKRTTVDGQIFDILNPLIERDKSPKRFFTLHLMGSHPDFKERYTENFSVFKPEMYPEEWSSRRRRKVSAYDNSVLYNDSIISGFIKDFADKEAIVFYYSDHGLDIFQSTDDYVGHARGDKLSKKYGREIPFMIYVSPKYKQRFPEIVANIKSKTGEHINTANFIYMFMDIVGVRFVNRDTKGLSPFGMVNH